MIFSKKEKVRVGTIIVAILMLLFSYVIISGVVVYFFPNLDNVVIKKTTRIIPYPAVLVDSKFITFKKINDNLNGVKSFYENQDFSELGLRVDFSTEDGKKRLKVKEKEVLQKLIDNSVIESEAKKRNINITSDIVDQEVDRKLKEYGTGDYLKENLQKLYGWGMEEFKDNIVKPDLYKEKLIEDMKKNDQSFMTAKNKIEEAQKELATGKDFSELAKKYSDGATAENGGELGWFNFSQMLPEVANVASMFEKGQTSDIIESSIGYHIIKIEDKKNENGADMVKLSQIFVKAESFPDWLEKAENNHKFFILDREFIWNNEKNVVEFRDKDMQNFEDQLLKNSNNDPSIIF